MFLVVIRWRWIVCLLCHFQLTLIVWKNNCILEALRHLCLILWPSFLVLLPPRAAGVVEGDLAAVEAYKSSGGDIARQLTADEVHLLNRSSAFDVGYTLVHLAIRFQRQDMLAILLTEVSTQMDSFSTPLELKQHYLWATLT